MIFILYINHINFLQNFFFQWFVVDIYIGLHAFIFLICYYSLLSLKLGKFYPPPCMLINEKSLFPWLPPSPIIKRNKKYTNFIGNWAFLAGLKMEKWELIDFLMRVFLLLYWRHIKTLNYEYVYSKKSSNFGLS